MSSYLNGYIYYSTIYRDITRAKIKNIAEWQTGQVSPPYA